MKKIIMALALIASTVAMASVEVYQFKSSIKIPALAGNAKSGYYRNYTTTSMNGTLTIDTEAESNDVAVIHATIAKTREVVDIVLDEDILAVLAGKKQTVAAVRFSGADEDDVIKVDCAGVGATRVKTTGCTPCGLSTTCTRVTKLSGYLVGEYDCGCDNAQYATIDDDCDVDYDEDTTIAPIYGSWNITLKTVDGAKYK